jgi:hypothetical protein
VGSNQRLAVATQNRAALLKRDLSAKNFSFPPGQWAAMSPLVEIYCGK